MNFLGHYAFDRQQGDSLYNAGLLGPDLIRNASMGQFKPNWKLESEPEAWHRGARQHLWRDAWFHTHDFFKTVYDENRDAIRAAFQSVQIPRFYFGLHVAIEMSLDKTLLIQEPNLAQAMYRDLELSVPTIADWLHRQGAAEAIAGVERFVDSRYIERYQEPSDLAYGLMRVYMQTGASQAEWEPEQLQVAAEAMQQLVKASSMHLHLLHT